MIDHEERFCAICRTKFTPSKYRPTQSVCSNKNCQYQRQLNNMIKWRQKNPDYFKTVSIYDAKKSKEWRESHAEYLKQYRLTHRERHREYMRIYMRMRYKKDPDR